MSQVDIKNDTEKYTMLLHHYLEIIHKDNKKNDFSFAIMQETSRFFEQFLSGYMSLHKENIHKILYYYAQIVIEKLPPFAKSVLPLLVFFNKE